MNIMPSNLKPLEVANQFICRGWSPIPVPFRMKEPVLTGWSKLRITTDTAPKYFNGKDQNIGVLLGEPSGWLIDLDMDWPEVARMRRYFIGETLTFGRSGNPSSHALVIAENAITRKFSLSRQPESMILEIRSTGCQTIFPSSTHKDTGELIDWDNENPILKIDADELERRCGVWASASLLLRHWTPGVRDDLATAICGTLLRGGWDINSVDDFIEIIALEAGDNEILARLKASRLAKGLDSNGHVPGLPRLREILGSQEADKIIDWMNLGIFSGFKCTDIGNSERLAAQYGQDSRYCPEFSKWLTWDGHRWIFDEDGEMVRRAKNTAQSIYSEAASSSGSESTTLGKWAITSSSVGKITAMIELAKSRQELVVRQRELDVDSMLLGTTDGVINLKTGKLYEPSREDYITKQASVRFDKNATCPNWINFLDKVMNGNTEMVKFLQRTVGYCLTGSTQEQCIFLLYGTGANGKSTFLNVLRALFGDYGMQAPAEMLMTKHDGGVPNDIARLRGARFVATSETEEGRRFAEALVKQLTGGDTISARFLYGEYFDFQPSHKILLATNHKPVIRGNDRAIWRRIRLIPFTVAIPPEEQDKCLEQKLRAELPGILNWAIEGCLEWQYMEGLKEPIEVVSATSEYRDEMNIIAAWMDSQCVVHPNAKGKVGNLYKDYKEWAEDTGEFVMSQRFFGRKLEEHGFEKHETTVSGKSGIFVIGLGLKMQEV